MTYKRWVKLESPKRSKSPSAHLVRYKKSNPQVPILEDLVDGTHVETARRQSVQCHLPISAIRYIYPLLAMPHWMWVALSEIIEVLVSNNGQS